jgi:hypothetical protein
LAVLLYRFEQFTGKIPMDIVMDREFTDWNDIRDYAKNAVNVLAVQGILNGYEDGSFRPMGQATRAEFAAIIHRSIEASAEREAQSFAMAYANPTVDIYIDKSALEAIERVLVTTVEIPRNKTGLF